MAAMPLILSAAISLSCAVRPGMVAQSVPSACISAPPPAVRWIAPAATRDRRLLDRECRRIGDPVVIDRPAVTPPSVTALTVVSWNAHAGAGNLGALVSALKQGRLTNSGSVEVFVLLVQEAARVLEPREAPSNDVVAAARQLGLAVVYVPGMQNGSTGRDRGIAILSSLSLADVTVVELPFERQRRVAVLATVAPPSADGHRKPIRIVSAHLDVGFMFTRGGGEAARYRQAEALRDAIGQTPMPLVIGGDFNTSTERAERAVQTMAASYPDAIQPPSPTWRGPLGLRRQLDRIFADADGRRVTVRTVPDRFGSDHHPLLAQIPLE